MCVCAILVCGVFLTLNASGFVCELPIAGVPDGPTLRTKNGSDTLGRRVLRNNDTFAYNARSELTNAVMNANAYGYGYDGIGNLLFFAAGTVTNAYMANALNQYASITGGATASPIYDPDCNMLTNGVWSYAWDAENRSGIGVVFRH